MKRIFIIISFFIKNPYKSSLHLGSGFNAHNLQKFINEFNHKGGNIAFQSFEQFKPGVQAAILIELPEKFFWS